MTPEPELNLVDARRISPPPTKVEALRAFDQARALLEGGALQYPRGRSEFDAHMTIVMAYRYSLVPR